MEVVLLRDVEKLGKEGDVVKVKDGYGRNYLIPNKIAVKKSEDAVKVLELKKKKRQVEEKKSIEKAKELAAKIESLSCTISVESGLEDKIFGAVTHESIRNTLRLEGIDIDKKQVILDEPIKKLGVYQIKIKLAPEVTASLRVWVVKK